MATETGRRTRLDSEVFRLPVERIRAGDYSDAYFNFTRQLLQELDSHPRVTMQVFQKHQSILGGIDEALAVLRLCSDDWEALEVRALYEGDEIAPMETVLTIEGDYSLFAHLETVYLGCLARRSLIMRNVSEVVEAARGKPILFFPARHDHWLVQTGDGWAAHVAGAIGVSTHAQGAGGGARGGGGPEAGGPGGAGGGARGGAPRTCRDASAPAGSEPARLVRGTATAGAGGGLRDALGELVGAQAGDDVRQGCPAVI